MNTTETETRIDWQPTALKWRDESLDYLAQLWSAYRSGGGEVWKASLAYFTDAKPGWVELVDLAAEYATLEEAKAAVAEALTEHVDLLASERRELRGMAR